MQQTIIVLTDDLTGKDIPDGEGGTIRFGLDGQLYEIDLNEVNAEKLKSTFTKYILAGRKVKPNGHHPTGRRGRTTTRRDTHSIATAATRIREQMAHREPAPMPPPPPEARYSTSTPGVAVAEYPDNTAPGTFDPKTVRAWAQSKGIDVPARGRVPREVVMQFRQWEASQ